MSGDDAAADRLPPRENPNPSPMNRIRRAFLTVLLTLAAMAAGLWISQNISRLWGGDSGELREFDIFGVPARITIPKSSGATIPAAELADMVEAAIRETASALDPADDDSDIHKLNRAGIGSRVEVGPVAWTAVMEALRWNRLTGGAYDPTDGPARRAYGLDKPGAEAWPDARPLEDALSRMDANALLFEREGMLLGWNRNGVEFDAGAFAKGYAVDRAVDVLVRHGVLNATVDIGGKVRVLGRRPGDPAVAWQAAVRNPRDDDQLLVTLDLAPSAAFANTGGEQYFTHDGARYQNHLDPRSGKPVADATASVTVVHPESCLAAEVLAETLLVMGEAGALEFVEEHKLGLFSVGVRAIMLIEDAGTLRKLDVSVDKAGHVSVVREVVAR